MFIFYFLVPLFLFSAQVDCKESQDITAINYLAKTRGYELNIFITASFFTYNGKKERTAEKQWESLIFLIDNLDLTKLNTFEAPTESRFTDRVMQANLIIETKDSVYTSMEFDHGHPPKEIQKVVANLLQLKDK